MIDQTQEQNHEEQVEDQNQVNDYNEPPKEKSETEEVQPKNTSNARRVIHIETCVDCKNHRSTTWHDEAKYHSNYNQVKAAIEALIPGIEVLRNIEESYVFGGFEIMHESKVLFSKRTSKLWPHPGAVAQRVQMYFNDLEAGKDVSAYGTGKEKASPPQKKKREERTFTSGITELSTFNKKYSQSVDDLRAAKRAEEQQRENLETQEEQREEQQEEQREQQDTLENQQENQEQGNQENENKGENEQKNPSQENVEQHERENVIGGGEREGEEAVKGGNGEYPGEGEGENREQNQENNEKGEEQNQNGENQPGANDTNQNNENQPEAGKEGEQVVDIAPVAEDNGENVEAPKDTKDESAAPENGNNAGDNFLLTAVKGATTNVAENTESAKQEEEQKSSAENPPAFLMGAMTGMTVNIAKNSDLAKEKKDESEYPEDFS